jgi:subtilisin family serine protease
MLLMRLCLYFALSLLLPSTDSFAEYVPGEILVKFKESATTVSIQGLHASTHSKQQKVFKTLKIHHIKLPKDTSVEEALQLYQQDPDVEYAEPNYIVSIAATPDDLSNNLWGLHNTGQNGGTSDADIDAPEAWDLTTGSTDVVIAVVDTGVAANHPDLSDNIWVNTGETNCSDGVDNDSNGYIDDCNGWDFLADDNDPTDYNGHGSHVAGTIAAVGNNSTGVTGVMWQAKIIPLRFLGVDGTGATSDAISAILYANANGAHVINNSWGGTGFSTPLKAAIDASSAVVVCAAGNGGLDGIGDDNDSTPFYPASYDSANIIAVAATDRNDDIASYSNFGLTSVDLAAPGHIIYSALPSLSTVPDPLPNGVLYSEDFDSTSGDLPVLGWSRGGTQSTWAVTTGTGNSSTNSLEDSPSADYENNTDSWAGYMTPFNSLKNNRFTLSFDWKGTIENGQDYLYINYSSDGISWNSADSITGSALNFTSFSTEITEATEPLDSVYIGFGLNSDSSVVGQGVFIDDVVLQRETISISSYSYANKNGTSMASPHVSGVAGLIKALNSSCSTAQIKSLILDNTENVVSLSGKAVTEGRLNAFNALSAVQCAQPAPSSSGGGGGGGCFIATAAYGSIMHPYVKELRNFRDRYLLTNVLGRQFVTFYYKYSPAAAYMIRNRELLKVTVRIMLLPIVMLVAFPYISLITFIAFTVTSMFLVRTYKMRMNIRSGLDRNKL